MKQTYINSKASLWRRKANKFIDYKADSVNAVNSNPSNQCKQLHVLGFSEEMNSKKVKKELLYLQGVPKSTQIASSLQELYYTQR